MNYWITPIKSDDRHTDLEWIEILVCDEHSYDIGIPGRKSLEPGDWICFYAKSIKGVVAHAKVQSKPDDDGYFDLDNERYYSHAPGIIDGDMRERLNAFEGKRMSKFWGWFVLTTRQISEHDFKLLTGVQ